MNSRSPRRATRLGIVGAVAAVSALVAACGGSSGKGSGGHSSGSAQSLQAMLSSFPSLLAQAKKEASSGTFNIWISTPKLDKTHKDLFAAFEKQFGLPKINYKWVNTSSPTVDRQFLQEVKAGKVTPDIIDFSASELGVSMLPHLLSVKWASLLGEKLPSISEAIADVSVPSFRDKAVAAWDAAKVAMWNTKEVPNASDVPTTLEGYADSRWKGKVAIPSTGFGLDGLAVKLGQEPVLAIAKQLKDNHPVFVPSSPAAITAVGTGQAALTFVGTIGTVERLKTEGQPVDWKPMAAGIPLQNQINGVPAEADMPALGVLFAAWMGTDGQQILIKDEYVGRFNNPDTPGNAQLKSQYPDAQPIPVADVDDMSVITEMREKASKIFTGVGG